ncbi:hypothetical protein Ahia01_001116000 [Argonauta hians]
MRIYIRRIVLGLLLLLAIPFLWVNISGDISGKWKTIIKNRSKIDPSSLAYTFTLSRRRLTTRYIRQNVNTFSAILVSHNISNKNNKYKKKLPAGIKVSTYAVFNTLRTSNKSKVDGGGNSKDGKEMQKEKKSEKKEKKNNKKQRNTVYKHRLKHLPPNECDNLKGEIPDGKYQTWQFMSKKREVWVFSAYHENLTGPYIRIIGAKSRWIAGNIHCQLWYNVTGSNNSTDTKSHVVIVPAIVKNIPEDHGRIYTACYFLCPLHKVKVPPVSVSIVLKKECQKPENYVLVTPNSVAKEEDKKQFTVCLSPLHTEYNNIYELVEWMEINQLFGADYFVFYNSSIGPTARKILNQYTNEGLSEIVQWNIPFEYNLKKEPFGIHYHAQLAAINDCLYRNLYKSKYVVFIDIDEIIVPKEQRNWLSLINNIKHTANIGAYIFRSTFFRKEWEDTEKKFSGKNIAEKYNLSSLLKLKREHKIFPVYIRSKTIVNPLKVETVGIHNIWRFRPGYIASEIRTTQGLLHHYRDFENPKDKNRLYDNSTLTYKDDILKRITKRWQVLENILK